MRVEMLVGYGSYEQGRIYDLKPAEAQLLLRRGWARKPPPKEKK